MKKLLIAFFVLFSTVASAQKFTEINNYQAPIGLAVKNYFSIPSGPTPTFGNVSRRDSGALFWRTTDSSLYAWSGYQWVVVAGSGGGGTGCSLDSITVNGDRSLYVVWTSCGTQYFPTLLKYVRGEDPIRYDPGVNQSDTGVISCPTCPKFGNGLTDGGIVSHDTLYRYNVTAATYVIGGVAYSAPQITVTLAAADATFDRVDIITADTSGNIVVLTGTPAANPAWPNIDPSTQLTQPLSVITVKAGTTTPPGVTHLSVWDENLNTPTEWAPAPSAGYAPNFNNVTSGTVAHGVKSIDFPSYTVNRSVTFTGAATTDRNNWTLLTMNIKLKAPLAAASAVRVWFSNGTTNVTTALTLTTAHGFDKTSSAYQNISVPLSGLSFTSNTFNRVNFLVTGTGGGLYLDYVQLQGGIATGSSNFVEDVRRRPGTDSVEKRVNGIWVYAYRDSTGSGVGSQNLQQVTNTGNTTTRAIRGSVFEATDRIGINMDSAGHMIATGYGSNIFFDRATGKLLFQSSTNSASAGGNPVYAQGTLYINPNGSISLGNYGAGLFPGTAVKNLAVDATGNVIEVAAGAGVTNVDSTIRAKNILGFPAANAFGDSYAFGTGLVSQGLAFFNLVAKKYGFSLSNYAQPGTGIGQMSWQNYKFNPAYNISKPTFMLYGFNDARSQLNPTRFYAKIENATRAAIANQFLNGALAASDASLTKTGTWSTQDTWTLYGGKAKYITPGGLGQKTSTTGDQITYSTTADAIVIGFIGTVSTTGSFSVNVGAMTDTVNTAERTDGLAVLYDSTTATGLSCVKVYSGLGTASKTVTIKNLGGQIIIDYVGTLKTIRDSCAAFFATSIQKINPSGWEVGPGIYKGSNRIVELANARIKYVISEFNSLNKNYPIYYVDINKYVLPETDYQADSLHWNASGHSKAALAYIDFLNRPLSTYGAIDQPQGTDFQLPGYLAKDELSNLNLSFGGLLKITTGSFNIATGSRALASNTTGIQNIGIGGSALLNNTTGNYNTAIGHASMLNSIAASNNTSVGALSLNLHKSNGFNTAVGTQSLALDTSGTQNTAIGASSMYNNTNGGLNTAIGESSMYSNKTGIWNSSMGVISMYSSVSGNYNTAIGTISLYNSTGNGNTGVGVQSGRSITSGSFNTFLGYDAGYNGGSGQSATVTNSTAIGYNTVTTASNTMVYGNSSITDQFFNGNINLTIGKKIIIPTGTNASVGSATLVAGTVTVATTAAATASKIFVTVTTPGGTQGFLSVPTIVNGTSFTITSTSSAETSIVNWWIIN